MIFSSLIFIFLFLPCAVGGYHLLHRLEHKRWALAFLLLASLVYYSYWKIEYLYIIAASIFFNYSVGQWLLEAVRFRRPVFFFALACNIGALLYYKYTDFAISIVNSVAGAQIPLQHILLPIGISFFTFQQIAFITDIYTRKYQPDKGFINYSLFVCFFPQLIAGPIVHHREMMPQFAAEKNLRLDWNNMYAGLVVFCLGLGKKVLVADIMSPTVTATFDAMNTVSCPEAWLGSLAYYLQIYFDFSAYSDMAIGCGLFFNIRLPENFISPYKAASIQEFWRRWHVTLSRWLRDYLYFPLGGSRKGEPRACFNILTAFIIGGLWHGPGWTFLLWGLLHGLALVIQRIWQRLSPLRLPWLLGWLLTFFFIFFSGIVIRASDLDAAAKMFEGLMGFSGMEISDQYRSLVSFEVAGVLLPHFRQRLLMGLFLLMALFAPNSMQILGEGKPRVFKTAWALAVGAAAVYALSFPDKVTEFIYFQF